MKRAVFIIAAMVLIIAAFWVGIGVGEINDGKYIDCKGKPYKVYLSRDGSATVEVESIGYIQQYGEDLIIYGEKEGEDE